MSHLVITITKLAKRGWALPSRLNNAEEMKGYQLSAEDRKFWLRAYASDRLEEDGDAFYEFADDMTLQVPALHDFMKWMLRCDKLPAMSKDDVVRRQSPRVGSRAGIRLALLGFSQRFNPLPWNEAFTL